MSKSKSALGKGLNNLLGGDSQLLVSSLNEIQGKVGSTIGEIALSAIVPNPDQPRRDFDQDKLRELSESIRSIGLVQPITVQTLSPGSYMIVAGERRWRASQMAGLETMPAYVRNIPAEEVVELALIENIQREDLNAIEVALAYQQIIDQKGLTHQELAQRVGKGRSAISNYLRLLTLPSEVQIGLTQRLIDMGHAKALLSIQDPERQIETYNLILAEHLSVRQVEDLAKNIAQMSTEAEEAIEESSPQSARPKLPQEYGVLEQHLTKVFSAKVTLRRNTQGKGKLTIPFASDEDLERIMSLLERIQH